MKTRYILTLIAVVFLLHLFWENAQASLYSGYQSFSQHFLMCFVGTIGDVVITLFVLACIWLLKKDKPRTGADFLVLAVIGFIVAVVIEQHALLVDKWNYTSAMPIIPWLNVGLAPIIQMALLLPLSFYLTKLLNQKSFG